MSPAATPLPDSGQRLGQSPRGRFALDYPVTFAALAPVVREPKERKSARPIGLSQLLLVSRYLEGHQPGLFGVKSQTIASNSFWQDFLHTASIPFPGEDDQQIVRVADQDRPPSKTGLDLFLKPPVHHFMQVQVGQQR